MKAFYPIQGSIGHILRLNKRVDISINKALISILQVRQLGYMLDSLLVKEVTEYAELEAYFLQGLYWSLGAGLLEDGRTKFDAQVKYLASMPTKEEDAGPGKMGLVLDLYGG